MARKVGQIIARGGGRWLIRVYLGRDYETKKRRQNKRNEQGTRTATLPQSSFDEGLGSGLRTIARTVHIYLSPLIATLIASMAEDVSLPHMAELPHNAEKPCEVLLPHMAELPHIAELPHMAEVSFRNSLLPHTVEAPHMAELPQSADESLTR
jgi:hypothetical protein